MRRTIASAVSWCACAASSSAQQIPTCRTDVDLVQIDVSVLDEQRRPVLGLTAGAFNVTIDGEPRKMLSIRFDGR